MNKLEASIVYLTSNYGDFHYYIDGIKKILFYADFLYFKKYNKSITEEKYIKTKKFAEPANFKKAIKTLIDRQEIFFGDTKKKIRSDGKQDILSPKEKECLREVKEQLESISQNWNISGLYTELWNVAEIGEEVPYELSLIEKNFPKNMRRE